MTEHNPLLWHLGPEDGSLDGDDDRTEAIGETLWIEGEPECEVRGFHACRYALDAVNYGHGLLLKRVRLHGLIHEEQDKWAAQGREPVWCVEPAAFKRYCHQFAIWCAVAASFTVRDIDERSVRAIAVKEQWLAGRASDGELDAAWAAARAVARSAANNVAWAAASAAANAAAKAGWTAAWAAASAATLGVSWDVAREEFERGVLALPRLTVMPDAAAPTDRATA